MYTFFLKPENLRLHYPVMLSQYNFLLPWLPACPMFGVSPPPAEISLLLSFLPLFSIKG
jgi:hypothetical protein